ncbi:5-oxoprolinase subunit C family protein [Staphylococcus pettenkoferi]|uniref:5-oxoprolinase subunit C family protein n=1 Tax=Staphylococcus pettenkoferi TaxID=170573 RepID=UPI0002432B3E|nr:biotin-dependent carboxyltransferase family protein [Staphylococcus pettenkoferi]ASE36221.1 allophanate hydrolase [Staphylococcus pettenkoferi]EHM72173.1 allophanate hydrolase subunit 2 [Staphylococcus pettenkoferi VCU012]MCY1579820.1 biotin-dependent carboxyltransferase family protein [Staphylococcus pettenkoferi]MCY1620283.1 biotin-dependent carboxyltransferase family protein [Staphylococcus pettenkoferi]
MSILINNPGLFTTVQDQGRYGFQDQGFSTAGALDLISYQLGQKLIGNDGPAIEFTVIGPTIRFTTPNTFVVTGGEFGSELNGEPIEMQSVYKAEKGDELKLGAAKQGARGYIFFGCPLDIPVVANSQSTHTRSHIGGFEGRTLKAQDRIQTIPNDEAKYRVGLSTDVQLVNTDETTIHIVKGPQFDRFSSDAVNAMSSSEYQISEQSDRMGYRLRGSEIPPEESADIISEPVALGSVQVPNDGNPIILLNDKQTVGGYTKIATVTQADLSILAQKQPGETIRFEWVTVEEAIESLQQLDEALQEALQEIERTPVYQIQQLRSTSKRLNALLKGEA